MSSGSMSLNSLPDELIHQILLQLPPTSVPAVQQVSRKFNDLAEPTVWRYFCLTQYVYWGEEHDIEMKFSEAIERNDWKEIFVERYRIDRAVSGEIESILASQICRAEKIQHIVGIGYDAKDTLLRHLHVNEEAEDVLARRYYADVALGCLHRSVAIMQWQKLQRGTSVPLSRALMAYDVFALRERCRGFDEVGIYRSRGNCAFTLTRKVSRTLDHIAQKITVEYPELSTWSTRQKAIGIAKYLRDSNLVGLSNATTYHNLQNNFISLALQDEQHPSLPLISVAIYCSVAQILGLNAVPCGFPLHVHAIIKPTRGFDLDGRTSLPGRQSEPMYLDPFRSDQETAVEDLRAQLVSMGIPPSVHESLLDSSPVDEIVRRTARNIITSIQTALQPVGGNGQSESLANATVPSTEDAYYAALWALVLLPDSDPAAPRVRSDRYLAHLERFMENHFPLDLGLFSLYILPAFQEHDRYDWLCDQLRILRARDSASKQVKRRSTAVTGYVKYRIGQVFRHRRYDYQAVITGWDKQCEMDENWIGQMRVDELPKGRYQSFYHVLADDGSVRYVAEENIHLLTGDIPYALIPLAGRHFKRWDPSTHTFISNVKDEYPDD